MAPGRIIKAEAPAFEALSGSGEAAGQTTAGGRQECGNEQQLSGYLTNAWSGPKSFGLPIHCSHPESFPLLRTSV